MCTLYRLLQGPAETVMEIAETLGNYAGYDVHRVPVLSERTYHHAETGATITITDAVMVMKTTLTSEEFVVDSGLSLPNEFISFI